MRAYVLEHDYADGTLGIVLGTEGEIDGGSLSITEAWLPRDKESWPHITHVFIPLPLYQRFKKLLSQWEAAMVENGLLGQENPDKWEKDS